MKKNILFLIILLFSITGCSTNYNLTIDSEAIFEDISITIPKNVVNEVEYENAISLPRLVYPLGTKYYTMEDNEDINNYYVNYSYNHDIDSYKNSNFLTKCYSTNSIINTEDNITIKTSDRFNCIEMEDGFYMDTVTVNIKTDLIVTSNNADKVNNNTYTWIFNKDNYTNKPINIEISKLDNNKFREKNIKDTINNIDNKEIIIIILVIIAISAITYVFIKRKNNKKNEI